VSNNVIVVVADLEDPKHGEVSVLDSPQKASRMVETLLESGFAQERIRIFSGDEMGMQVAHRPIVALVSPNGVATKPVAEEPPVDDQPVVTRSSSKAKTEVQVEAAATPFVRNGVRFSTQFRPA